MWPRVEGAGCGIARQGTATAMGCSGEAEYQSWRRAVCGVSVCALELTYRAADPIYLPRFPGSKINGALWAGLTTVANSHPDSRLRCTARRVLARHEPPENPAGFREKRFVLGLSHSPLRLLPNETFAFAILLFGETARAWPAWINAAAVLDLRPGLLELSRAVAATPSGPKDVRHLSEEEAVTTLGALAGLGDGRQAADDQASPPLPFLAQGAPAWQVLFHTPVVLEAKGQPILDVPTAEPLIVSALSSLGSAAAARPGAENTLRLRALAAQATAQPRSLRRVRALHHRGHDLHGLIGEVYFPHLPEVLREILWLAQFTHLGQLSAFGLGRYTLRPAEAT